MLLSNIRSYLSERGRAPLSDMSVHFDSSPDALRGMLQHLIHKGRVREVEGNSCNGCCKCAPETLEIYEWVA
ncbi:MAG: FeoC-like transcriptional regulator [Magnetovibrio sp.]|nr:FeoC-like transcriptional regulator [Magnetovibrio sp.]